MDDTNTTATSAYLDRYKARESFTGLDGRVYTVRPLRPSEIFRLRDLLRDCEDTSINVLSAVASICTIFDGQTEVRVPFPKSRGEIESLLDKIDFEGLATLSASFGKVNGAEERKAEAADAA